VSRALKRLESAGEVEVIDGRTVLVDPLFALWLERLSSGVAGAEGRSSMTSGSRRVRAPASSSRFSSRSARGSLSGTRRPSRISASSTPPSRPPYVV
jgi:hypothetical protein